MSRPPTRRAVARAWLDETIARAEEHGSLPCRLPTIAAMARAAGVNPATMRSAVSAMAAAGRLTVKPGAGITLTPPQVRPDPKPKALHRWEQIRNDLATGIVAGQYGPAGALPTRKELRVRFGAGTRSVSRALRSLVDDHLIQPHGRGYRVASGRATYGRSSITVVAVSEDTRALSTFTNRSMEFWRALEHGARHHGLNLHVVSAGDAGRAWPPSRSVGRELQSRDSVGILLWGLGLQDRVHRLTPWLCGFGKPVAVVDDQLDITLPARASSPTPVALFRVLTNEDAGRAVAHALVQHGHRRVAYLSRSPDEPWADQRLDGIRKAFAAAGIPSAVAAFAPETRVPWGIRSQWAGLPAARAVMDSVHDLARSLGGDAAMPAPRVNSELVNYLWDSRIVVELNPLFERAMHDTSLTAWIGANDAICRLAMDFLRSHGLEPGRDRAVIGFDDELDSTGYGLSSFNFATAAQAQACLRFLLNPVSRRPGVRRSVVDAPGFVVERQSTAGWRRGDGATGSRV